MPGGEQRSGKTSLDDMSLAEVGPRMCLNPIKIFSGSHFGATLYNNPQFMTPTAMRIEAKKELQEKYTNRVQARSDRKEYVDDVVKGVKDILRKDHVRNVFRTTLSENGMEED